MVKVIRSPAKVSWHIVIERNGVCVETADTKQKAEVIACAMNSIMRGWKL